MADKKIILFDGVCSFCNFWVKFAFHRNKKKDLFFMSLQDPRAKQLLESFEFNTTTLRSVVFLNQGKLYSQSSAAFEICRHLDGGWRLISLLLVIPTSVRDLLYNFVAQRRYQWFGKLDVCMVPSDEMKSQFL